MRRPGFTHRADHAKFFGPAMQARFHELYTVLRTRRRSHREMVSKHRNSVL